MPPMTTPPDIPDDDDVILKPRDVHHFRSVAIGALALLLVLYLHLLPALFSGVGGFVLYRSLRTRVRAHLENRGAWITYLLVAIVLATLGFALFEGFELLLSASTGGLAKLLRILLYQMLDCLHHFVLADMRSLDPDSLAFSKQQKVAPAHQPGRNAANSRTPDTAISPGSPPGRRSNHGLPTTGRPVPPGYRAPN